MLKGMNMGIEKDEKRKFGTFNGNKFAKEKSHKFF